MQYLRHTKTLFIVYPKLRLNRVSYILSGSPTWRVSKWWAGKGSPELSGLISTLLPALCGRWQRTPTPPSFSPCIRRDTEHLHFDHQVAFTWSTSGPCCGLAVFNVAERDNHLGAFKLAFKPSHRPILSEPLRDLINLTYDFTFWISLKSAHFSPRLSSHIGLYYTMNQPPTGTFWPLLTCSSCCNKEGIFETHVTKHAMSLA